MADPTVGTQLDTDLARLPWALDAAGYTDLVASFTPHLVRAQAWARAAGMLDGPLRALAGLFLLNERVGVDLLPAPVAERLPGLAAGGVVHLDESGRARLPDLVLVRPYGVWLFAQRPQTSPTLYVGDDSIGLAGRLALRPGRCLDLCAGPGIQALLCAARGRPVVAAEINPVAAALCRVNVAVNGLTDLVSVRCGDLYGCVPGESFANILANPPLLPIPEGVTYPFVGAGGPDGLRVVWRILSALPRHLAPGGRFQLIGMTLSDGLLPTPLDALADWAWRTGFDLTMAVTAHARADADSLWVRGVAATAAEHGGLDYDKTHAALAEGYAALGASHVCTYALSGSSGAGGLNYVDVSPEEGDGWSWFV
jgi:release factor glutamine methyltransferase